MDYDYIKQIAMQSPYLAMDKELVKGYVLYLTYMAQHCVYELLIESGEDFQWEEFVYAIRSNKNLRMATKAAIEQAIADFQKNSSFNFTTKDAPYIFDKLPKHEDGDPHFSQIYSDKEGAALVTAFILQAEIGYYTLLLNAGEKNYSWVKYILELKKNKEMWEIVTAAVRDGLSRLDFKAAWMSDEVGKMLEDLMK